MFPRSSPRPGRRHGPRTPALLLIGLFLSLTGALRAEPIPDGFWLEALGSAHRTERQLAAEALRELGPDAIPVLLVGLRSDSDHRVGWSARILGELGPVARDLVPDLEALLAVADGRLAGEIRAALEAIASQDPSSAASPREVARRPAPVPHDQAAPAPFDPVTPVPHDRAVPVSIDRPALIRSRDFARVPLATDPGAMVRMRRAMEARDVAQVRDLVRTGQVCFVPSGVPCRVTREAPTFSEVIVTHPTHRRPERLIVSKDFLREVALEARLPAARYRIADAVRPG